MKIIPRIRYKHQVESSLKRNPVTALLGPRQCGKSTLARELASQHKGVYYDLENPEDLARLENPLRELEAKKGLIILDEIQRAQHIFPVLRVLADRQPTPARFLLLGSASPTLARASSETLAGRIEFTDMSGFDLEEVGVPRWKTLWIRGGFPRSFLAHSEKESMVWRENFIRTFLERDIPQLGLQIPATTLRHFWTMISHYHGQIWNGSEIGRSLGLAHTTTRRYLDILTGALVIRQLQPWFENVGKRVVKSPKIYVRDPGLLHALMKIPDMNALSGHPKLGASWEGFALEQVLRFSRAQETYFWATHSGSELDLLLFAKGKRYGFEFKYSDAPRATRSMQEAITHLNLSQLFVVYPGKTSFDCTDRIRAVCIGDLQNCCHKIFG